MKITAPLLLLPLLLAACGTQSATPAPQSSPVSNSGRSIGPSYIEAFEAGVQRDLTSLGLSGSISAQATAPKSYLNVLKVNDTTARAYMKTTYPAATGCALDWGDGTATATITTPSVVATDKADHAYTQSGTYTVKLTCGSDVKTSTFTAIVPQTNLGLMDDYTGDFAVQGSDGTYNYLYTGLGSSYLNKGFTFTSDSIYAAKGSYFGVPEGNTAFLFIRDTTISVASGDIFDVKSLTFSNYQGGETSFTAYDAEGSIIGSINTPESRAGVPVTTVVVNWKGVSKIKAYNPRFFTFDDMSATIQLRPL